MRHAQSEFERQYHITHLMLDGLNNAQVNFAIENRKKSAVWTLFFRTINWVAYTIWWNRNCSIIRNRCKFSRIYINEWGREFFFQHFRSYFFHIDLLVYRSPQPVHRYLVNVLAWSNSIMMHPILTSLAFWRKKYGNKCEFSRTKNIRSVISGC